MSSSLLDYEKFTFFRAASILEVPHLIFHNPILSFFSGIAVGLTFTNFIYSVYFTWDHRCYEAEQKREERDRHPSNQREKHELRPVCELSFPSVIMALRVSYSLL